MQTRRPVAVVTGGAGGIGGETARALGRRGFKVVLADLDGRAAAARAEHLRADGVDAMAVGVDVADEAGVKAMVGQVTGRWGGIDVLVNNAGIESMEPFLEIDVAEFERVMRVNTTGTWICCRAVIPPMQAAGGGAIVNVSSVAGQRGGGLLGTAAYSTSKGAVIALTKALAREFAGANIRVNAVAPALTQTDLLQRQLDRAPAGTRERIVSQTPLARAADPSEVAAVIAFLASSDASFVTGHVVNVDGGIAI